MRRNDDDDALMPIGKVIAEHETAMRERLDLETDDREAEVARLVELGATVVHDKDEWGVRWTTLTDPEGNEFCVASHG